VRFDWARPVRLARILVSDAERFPGASVDHSTTLSVASLWLRGGRPRAEPQARISDATFFLRRTLRRVGIFGGAASGGRAAQALCARACKRRAGMGATFGGLTARADGTKRRGGRQALCWLLASSAVLTRFLNCSGCAGASVLPGSGSSLFCCALLYSCRAASPPPTFCWRA